MANFNSEKIMTLKPVVMKKQLFGHLEALHNTKTEFNFPVVIISPQEVFKFFGRFAHQVVRPGN